MLRHGLKSFSSVNLQRSTKVSAQEVVFGIYENLSILNANKIESITKNNFEKFLLYYTRKKKH